MATKLEFSSGYRFREGGKITAILDMDGKLSIPDPSGSLENWESWKDYVKEKLEDKPSTGKEEEKLDQIGIAFGVWEPILPEEGDTVKTVRQSQQQENEMATATATKAVAKKVAVAKKAAPAAKAVKTAKPVTEKVLGPCICGCGGQTTGNFCPGHDARVHGWQKKIERGETKFSEYPASAQKYMKEKGTKQGAKQVA